MVTTLQERDQALAVAKAAIQKRHTLLTSFIVEALRQRGWSSPAPEIMELEAKGGLVDHEVAVWPIGEGYCISIGEGVYVHAEHRFVGASGKTNRLLEDFFKKIMGWQTSP